MHFTRHWTKGVLLAGSLVLQPVLFAQEQKPAEKKEEKKDEKKKGLPLASERKIEFTTDEGTWISLDVSPDGKTIVFELLGDLYAMPSEGGEAKRLPVSDSSQKDGNTMAFDSQPRFSPDGKWIAFLSDREGVENVWICKSDGTEPKQLSKDTSGAFLSPTWTEDSLYVGVSHATPASGTAELWMYHIQGGSGIQVNKAAAIPQTPFNQRPNIYGAVASRDGKYWFYARSRGGHQYNRLDFPIWEIVRRDRVTGDEDVLTDAPGSAIRPALSPDGTKLIYGTRYEADTALRIRDLSTGEDRWLKYPIQRDDQESRGTRDTLPGYAFMPDGKEIVISYGGKINRLNITTGEDRPIPFTARVSQELGPLLEFPARVEEGPVRARLVQAPEQSPDGKQIAFSALTNLYTMEIPGGKPVLLPNVKDRGYQPAWSPDGQWIAYVTWTVDGGHIWKARADGHGAAQQLTKVAEYYREPVWTPDGTKIVALRTTRQARVERVDEWGGPPINSELFWIPANGGAATMILPARGARKPHFGPEKDRIYLHTSQGLISLRFDGTDRRNHVRVVGKSRGTEPAPAEEVRIGPDGTRALARVNGQLWYLHVPVVGGEAPQVNVDQPAVAVKKLTDVGVDNFDWADSGKTITWSLGSSFFRQPVNTITFEEPKKDEKKDDSADKKDSAKADAKPEKKPPLYQEIEVVVERPRHTPTGSIVLRGAKIITMKGDEIIPDGEIVVKDNRIVAIGPRGKVAVPADAKVWDVKGHTIMPGLVDIHAHWSEVRQGVLDTQAWTLLANLAYGVTAGRDPQTMSNDMFAYQDLVETGDILGPRSYNTGPGVFANTDFQSAEDASNVVEKYKKYYRTNTLKSYVVGTRKQRQWMIEACKKHQMMPTTEGALDLKLDLTHVIDGFSGNEHAFPIVPLYKDVAQLVAQSKITYTPTLLVAYGGPFAENYFYETTEVHDDAKLRHFMPHNIIDQDTQRRPWFRREQHVFGRLAESAGKILRVGGRVGMGGHGQLQGLQCHWEMWGLASGGLTPLEVIRIATYNGAQAIGFLQDFGSLEPGKMADLLILSKDPMVDIRNTNTIHWVMKNGELFEGDTLNEVWPVQKPLEPLWWWKDKP